MTVREFGRQNSETIFLIHGGGLSWWNYRDAAEKLAERYHVLLPVLDGHGDSDRPFTGMEDNARRLIDFIDARFGGQVTTLGGLSLGGQVAVEMLSLRPDICRYGFLEGVLVKPMNLTHAMIGPSVEMSYGLIRKCWFAKLQAAYLRIPKERFEDYYRDSCRISKADMIAFLEANSCYELRSSLSKTSAKILITAGSREQKCILESAGILGKAIPESRVEILPGLRHGDLSLNYPERYVRLLRCWMEKGAIQNETL